MDWYFDGIHNDIPIHSFLQSLYYYPISRFQLHFLFPEGSAVLRWSEYIGALKLIVPQVFVFIYVFTTNAIGLDLSVQYAIYITSEYKSYTKLRCTFEFVERVAHRSKSHGGGWAKSSRVHLFCKNCIVIRKLLFVCTSTIYMILQCNEYRPCHRGHILFHLFQVLPLGRRHIQWYVEIL